MLTKSSVQKKFKGGERVRLPANEKEGWPEEYGHVCGEEREVDEDAIFPGMYVVRVDPEYRSLDTGYFDDGLREVHEDQMEKI